MLRRAFTREFKLAAVRRLEAGVSLAEVARGLEVSPNVLRRWQREFRQTPGNAFPGQGQRRWSEGQIAELERKIGRQAVENFSTGEMRNFQSALTDLDFFGRFTSKEENLLA
jgi:transposase-like protein